MPETLNDDECYRAFLVLDTAARLLRGRDARSNALRERFLPYYRDWHAANPYKVHPSAYEQKPAAVPVEGNPSVGRMRRADAVALALSIMTPPDDEQRGD